MIRASATVALAVAAVLAASAAGGDEGAACTVAEMLTRYNAGLAALMAKDGERARGHFETLARQGFPPAQRQMAHFHAEGKAGVVLDVNAAAKWAAVAAKNGDQGALDLSASLKKTLGETGFAFAAESAKEWRPELPACLDPQSQERKPVDRTSVRIGNSVVRVVGKDSLTDNVLGKIFDQAELVIRTARQHSTLGALFLPSVRVFEILPGDKYDRYVGWKPGEAGSTLQLTIANLLDRSPAFAATALMLEAARDVYGRLPDSRFADPYLWIYRGKKVHQSVYPDVDNKVFVEAVKKALDLMETVPAELRRPLEFIDEIRYNPQSKHMTKSGTTDAAVGYYNDALSVEGRRIVFVRRDMKWSSNADLFLTLVHEGTHALQHATAERHDRELPGKRAALTHKVGGGGADALRREIAEMEEYADLWFRRVAGAEPKKRVVKFECEATVVEIKAAIAFGLDPSAVESSSYMSVCDDAKTMLVGWKDERLRKGLKNLPK